MKRFLPAVTAMMALLCAAALAQERVDTLTYAVFPYLPDVGYYQEIIERRWAETEPDIWLIRAEWDCYDDGAPEGIDVVMYDAVTLERLVADGMIRPIDPTAVRQDGLSVWDSGLIRLNGEGQLVLRAEWDEKAGRVRAGAPYEKAAYVYLSAGYDPQNTYDLLILCHGIGGSEAEWGLPSKNSRVRQIMDNLIDRGEIRPFIVVTPNGRAGKAEDYSPYYLFDRELREDLLPAVQAAYAVDTSDRNRCALASANAAVQNLDALTGQLNEDNCFVQLVPGVHDFNVWYLGFYNFARMIGSPD